MGTKNNHGRRALLTVLAALCCMALFTGCEDDDTDTDISATRFNVDRDLKNYSDADEYTWDTTLNQAVATLRIDDFREGDTVLKVYDARGKLLLSAALNTANNAYFLGNGSYVLQRQTAVGVPGPWRVVLGYGDFTGEYELTLE